MLGFAQLNNPNADVDWLSGKVENGNRIISTGDPLLLIAPDSRACKEAGKMSVEGKDYLVQDGDIMHFRFNV